MSTDEDPWKPFKDAIRRSCEKAEDAPFEKSGNGWWGVLGGFCPVQGQGSVDGRYWYFRARHEHWSFEVYTESCEYDLPSEDKRVWWAQAEYDGDASWMPFSDAWSLIESCIATGRETSWAMPDKSVAEDPK